MKIYLNGREYRIPPNMQGKELNAIDFDIAQGLPPQVVYGYGDNADAYDIDEFEV